MSRSMMVCVNTRFFEDEGIFNDFEDMGEEVMVDVEFDIEPAQEETWTDPGFPAELEIIEVTAIEDIGPFKANEIIDQIPDNRVKEMVWDRLKAFSLIEHTYGTD